jgi:hypothetical protein
MVKTTTVTGCKRRTKTTTVKFNAPQALGVGRITFPSFNGIQGVLLCIHVLAGVRQSTDWAIFISLFDLSMVWHRFLVGHLPKDVVACDGTSIGLSMGG